MRRIVMLLSGDDMTPPTLGHSLKSALKRP
jgi:hypothetical protein